MDIVRLAINKPVGVVVSVLLLVMFGLIGLGSIPIQLTPTVDRPAITVTTEWPGRSPQEIVDEIVKEQEEQLKNIANLKRMRSSSSQGLATISLEFYIGSDMGRALQEVSDSLRQVPEYPDEVEEPRVTATEGDAENAIAWIIIDLDPDDRHKHPDFDITTLYDELDQEVKPYLERVGGVAEVNIFGGREREARVLLDPTSLAQRSLNHVDVIQALRGENTNVSAGSIAEGKRDYRVRLVGQYDDPNQILDTVVAYRDGRPVYVRDVATVEISHEKRRGFVRAFGTPSIAMNLKRQSGANVVQVMEEVRVRLDEVRTDILPNLGGESLGGPVGPSLRMRQVYDETVYIESAIGLVTQNLWVGGAIAGLVLLVFLRSFRSTAIIGVAIPVSIIGTFLAMRLMGRTLNVVSLAGLAFAVGMVVDNAIVVLENVYRRLQEGEPPLRAAYQGGREVWGAVLASTLTTVAVFIPVLTIEEEAGQLFRDIALAIVAAVVLSLLVSITVIPSAAARVMHGDAIDASRQGPLRRAWKSLFGLGPALAIAVGAFGSAMRWMMTGWRGWTLRPAVIVLMTAASLFGAWKMMPPMDYLPAGNQNLVFGGLLIPPGLSVEQKEEIAERVERGIRPYAEVDRDDPAALAALDPIYRWSPDPDVELPPFDGVPVDTFFVGAFGDGMFVGARSGDDRKVVPVGTLVTNAMQTIPDTYGGASQASIFGRGVGGGSTINVELSGPDLEKVQALAMFAFGTIGNHFGWGLIQASPANFAVEEQELRIRITDRGRELGLSTADLGVAIRGLFDGAYVGDYMYADRAIDLRVLPVGGRIDFKEKLAQIPIATPAGRVVPVDSLVEFVPALAPQSIDRIEELPSVAISLRPPESMPVEEVMDWLETNVIQAARDMGLIDRTMRVRLEGTAASLEEVRGALFGQINGASASGGVLGTISRVTTVGVLIVGVGTTVFVAMRAVRRRQKLLFYGAVGALLMSALLAGVFLLIGAQPQLATARFVWALLVTYLLMCALFESFLYPLVIMFSVPLAVVGGFAGLAIVHWWTMRDPTVAPQNFDVLTMLGFVILIGVVVNNAILLVHQALNFMKGVGEEGDRLIEPRAPVDAIAESVRTRIRPIFMSVLTSVGGMMPLVLFPGAGSEMYRGLGSVVVGGLLVSTVFTLLLVPLLFSLILEMRAGLLSAFGAGSSSPSSPGERSEPASRPAERELQPA